MAFEVEEGLLSVFVSCRDGWLLLHGAKGTGGTALGLRKSDLEGSRLISIVLKHAMYHSS
jgi:hypothetical protein